MQPISWDLENVDVGLNRTGRASIDYKVFTQTRCSRPDTTCAIWDDCKAIGDIIWQRLPVRLTAVFAWRIIL